MGDQRFLTGERTAEGFYRVGNGLAACIARGLAYAPYADLLWVETSTPDLATARAFAAAIRAEHPDQLLAYNLVATAMAPTASTVALAGSTEHAQF